MTICANCGCPCFGAIHTNPKTGGKWCDDCFRYLPELRAADAPQAQEPTK